MLGIALTSITAGIFDIKHYLHLQLDPHISKHHQYWRLLTHHIACANSSDLFLVELMLYNVGVQIERSFGSAKYASFILVTALLSTITTFFSFAILHISGSVGPLFNHIPAGPIAIVFSNIYQYRRLVPPAYQFKVFGVEFNDKIWVYTVAGQLAISHLPATLLPTVLGLLSGFIYRSDVLQLKSWRIPHSIQLFAERWFGPLLGEARAVRRTNRVFPESRNRQRAGGVGAIEGDIVTTARRPRPNTSRSAHRSRQGGREATTSSSPGGQVISGPNANSSGEVMRQWMSELTGGARPSAGGVGTVRAPSESEIQMLTGMFPDVGREVILGVLQRSPNIEAAAETLLNSQR
ncbi:hypothetical protein AcW1_004766 [Taiwanofungus camphoratus]|nr:hypothetical protein AcV5_001147 [Antrodia cinnamomea]KAI0960179.1 hypothetical protein AcW1_004766 [Antrodia cinnamomea]